MSQHPQSPQSGSLSLRMIHAQCAFKRHASTPTVSSLCRDVNPLPSPACQSIVSAMPILGRSQKATLFLSILFFGGPCAPRRPSHPDFSVHLFQPAVRPAGRVFERCVQGLDRSNFRLRYTRLFSGGWCVGSPDRVPESLYSQSRPGKS